MRLKNIIDYKRFPEPSRGGWTRFTILVFSAIPLGCCSPALCAGLFWYTADESLLADDVCRNSTNDRQVVGCSISKDCKDPRGRPRDSGPPPPARRNLVLPLRRCHTK